MDEKNYTLKEVANIFRVEVETAADYVRDGRLHGFRAPGGKKILVPESEIKRFLLPTNERSRNRRGGGEAA
jgi:excisionase family DNA binding protein